MHEPTAPCALNTHTLGELTALFLTHAASYYRRRDGSPSREHLNYQPTLKRFETFAGTSSAPSKINRHQVRAWMDQLAAEELTRSYINSCLGRLRRFVRWGADLEYIDLKPVTEMSLVKQLQPFRSRAISQATPATSLIFTDLHARTACRLRAGEQTVAPNAVNSARQQTL